MWSTVYLSNRKSASVVFLKSLEVTVGVLGDARQWIWRSNLDKMKAWMKGRSSITRIAYFLPRSPFKMTISNLKSHIIILKSNFVPRCDKALFCWDCLKAKIILLSMSLDIKMSFWEMSQSPNLTLI